MDNAKTSSRLPSLDGWRAASILIVLGAHTGMVTSQHTKVMIDWIFDGDLGVRFFFVISGFLITWLLLQEQHKFGGINLKNFYIRRALRILPVYFAYVLAVLGFHLFADYRETPAGWGGMLTLTRNFTTGTSASAHLWSLSVEEQFYLIWPALLAWLHRHSVRATWMALSIPIIAAPVFRVGTYIFFQPHQHFLHSLNGIHLKPAFLERVFGGYSFFCYFDSLAFGCLAAILLTRHAALVTATIKSRRRALVWGAAGLVIIPHVMKNLGGAIPSILDLAFLTLGSGIQALGFGLLLLHSLIEPEWPGYRPLNFKLIRWIGALSYSLYIWQQIFWAKTWTGIEPTVRVVGSDWAYYWLIPTFIAASISYYGLERPFFQLRKRYGSAQKESPKLAS